MLEYRGGPMCIEEMLETRCKIRVEEDAKDIPINFETFGHRSHYLDLVFGFFISAIGVQWLGHRQGE